MYVFHLYDLGGFPSNSLQSDESRPNPCRRISTFAVSNSVRPGSHTLVSAKRLVSDCISHASSDECDELFELNSLNLIIEHP